MSEILTDQSRMPWGKYKNAQMANVPASYLMWCYEQNKCDASVKKYVEDNYRILQEEIEDEELKKKKF